MAGEPSDLTFYATYDSSINADYSKYGNIVPTSSSNVAIDNGTYNCGSGSVKPTVNNGRIQYSGGGEVIQQGTVLFYIYGASSVPTSTAYLFSINDDITWFNTIFLYARKSGGSGNLKMGATIWNDSGTVSLNIESGYDYATDTWHHLELDFDIDAGDTDLFVNGSSVGTNGTTMSRDGVTDSLYTFSHISSKTGYFIDGAQVYNTKRHDANFTPACGLLPDAGPAPFLSFGPRNHMMRGFAK